MRGESAAHRKGYSMEKQLRIKEKTIGTGRPLVCVPVMETTKEAIIDQFRLLALKEAEMIEWRIDAYDGSGDLNAIREVLEGIAPFVEKSILVYTYRSKEQGGLGELPQAKIYDVHQVGAESGIVDFVDLEYFEAKNAPVEIHRLHKMGTHVIASHHDFEETPQPEVMRMLLEQMGAGGADVVKLAVMPQNHSDVLALLTETNYFHETYPHQPLVTMSMGAIGCVSRVVGEAFGSCITFGTQGRASAPGQLPADRLAEVLTVLHEGMEG
jgi:3-dehydroquinate dehydratase-1